jgi:hypothetical protein
VSCHNCFEKEQLIIKWSIVSGCIHANYGCSFPAASHKKNFAMPRLPPAAVDFTGRRQEKQQPPAAADVTD